MSDQTPNPTDRPEDVPGAGQHQHGQPASEKGSEASTGGVPFSQARGDRPVPQPPYGQGPYGGPVPQPPYGPGPYAQPGGYGLAWQGQGPGQPPWTQGGQPWPNGAQYGSPQYGGGQSAPGQYGPGQPPQPQYGQPPYGQPQYGTGQYPQPPQGQPYPAARTPGYGVRYGQTGPEPRQRPAGLGRLALAIVTVAGVVGSVLSYVFGQAYGTLIVQLGLTPESLQDQSAVQSDPRVIAFAEQHALLANSVLILSLIGLVGFVLAIVATVQHRGRRFGVWGIVVGIVAPLLMLAALFLGVWPALQTLI